MGMFDTIVNIPVTCPRCGDSELKSAQIKPGPQNLEEYEFGKDKICINWCYEYYDSIIDKEKRIIRGIATCDRCRKETKEKMSELIDEAREKGELKCPEGSKYLFECEINGEDAFRVISKRLDDAYNGDKDIELFDVAIFIDKNGVPISADVIIKMNER